MVIHNPASAVGNIFKFASILILLWVFTAQLGYAAEDETVQGVMSKDPGSDLWRNVRQREFADSVSQVKSDQANILISISGEAWRQFRTMSLIPKAGIAILVGLVGVLLFRLIRGKIKLPNGRSGLKILRFTLNQRVAHWSVAILFVILALTGLLLMFGRMVIIPLMGKEAFGNIAYVAKNVHDYVGPAFAVALVFLFILFVRDNIPSLKQDLHWIMKGGGIFGKEHVSSDRYNAGEKGWFWLAALVGGAIVVSGLILHFPFFGQTRDTLEFYHVIHGIASIAMIVASFGHIYMGTAAMEGTFEVMKTGYCDANWAKEHHDLWYEKVKDSAEPEVQKTDSVESNEATSERA